MSESIQHLTSNIQRPPRPTWAEIDLNASVYNIRRIRSLLAPNGMVDIVRSAPACLKRRSGVLMDGVE